MVNDFNGHNSDIPLLSIDLTFHDGIDCRSSSGSRNMRPHIYTFYKLHKLFQRLAASSQSPLSQNRHHRASGRKELFPHLFCRSYSPTIAMKHRYQKFQCRERYIAPFAVQMPRIPQMTALLQGGQSNKNFEIDARMLLA